MYGQKVEIPDRCDNGEGSYLFQHEPTSDLSLAPSSTVVSFDDITIYRIGGGKESSIVLCLVFFSHVSRARISVGIVYRANHVSIRVPRGLHGRYVTVTFHLIEVILPFSHDEAVS